MNNERDCQYPHCSTSTKILAQIFLFTRARIKIMRYAEVEILCLVQHAPSQYNCRSSQSHFRLPGFHRYFKSTLDFGSALLHYFLNTSACGLLIKIRQSRKNAAIQVQCQAHQRTGQARNPLFACIRWKIKAFSVQGILHCPLRSDNDGSAYRDSYTSHG